MTTIAQFNAELDKYVGYNGAGTLDDPDTIFGAWFGINGPGADGQWCDMFLDYCAHNVGLALLPAPLGSAGVFNTWSAYQAAGRTFSTPQRGDLIVFTFSHIGFVESVNGNTLTTIQGNTVGDVAGSTRYGNTCRRKTVVLPNSTVRGFCRPVYTTAASTPASPPASPNEEIPVDQKDFNTLMDGYFNVRVPAPEKPVENSISERLSKRAAAFVRANGVADLQNRVVSLEAVADRIAKKLGA